jgi:hypothetical protein
MDFINGREKREAAEKNQPDEINPTEMQVSNCRSLAVQHSAKSIMSAR